MKIRTNLFLVSTIFLVLITTFSLIMFHSFNLINGTVKESQSIHKMIKDIFELDLVTYEYLIHHEKRMQQQWHFKYDSLGILLQRMEKEETDPECHTMIESMILNYELFGDLFSQVQTNHANKERLVPISLSPFLEKRLIAEALMRSHQVTAEAFELSTIIEQRIIQIQQKTTLVIISSIIGFVILSSYSTLHTIKSITTPVNELIKGTEIIGKGDWEHKIATRTKNEMGQLANSFNKMTNDLREITERLKATNAELESFSYSVSHDLRAPLRALDGFSKIMLEDYTGKLDTAGKGYLNRIRKASQRMAQLIDDLLSLSRVTRREIKLERVDLTELAKSITKDLEKTEPVRETEFVVQEAIIASGDAHLLRIVLENLLNNAWKFTGKKSRAKIEFGITKIDGEDVFFVRDNGVGFDMKYVDKLFGAFQRLHSDTEFAGTGIGLATVKRIITRHGGRIWAKSRVGKGATLYFKLSS